MASHKTCKILHLTTHLNIGGITSYIELTGARMIKKGYRIGILSSGGNVGEELKSQGFDVFQFAIRTKSELHLKLYWNLPAIKELVKKEQVDLLHAHTRVTQVLAFLISKLSGIPFVTTAHGFYKPRLSRKLFGCWGERVIAISPMVAEELKKTHKVREDKIRLIQNAIDLDEFQKRYSQKDPIALRRELGIPADAWVIGSVSRLVEDKGHAYLVEAVQKLKKNIPQIFLIILGDGREKGNLEQLIKKLNLRDSVKMIPAVRDVTGVLSVMNIFVHPATHREGFGFSIAEAMAVKKPVIATNIWAVNSIIQDGVNGYLVEPKSADGLAKAVKFVADHPEAAKVVAENGQRTALKLCSLDRMVSEMEKVYEEVVDASRQ